MLCSRFSFTILLLFLSLSIPAQPDNFLFGMGIPDGPDQGYDKLPVKARLTNDDYRAVRTSASLSQFTPTPKSQGQYGTCTAWAAGFCARTILEAQRQGWKDKNTIDDNVFSYGFIYRVTSSKANCNGAYVSDCIRNMRDVGIPKLVDFTEHCPQNAIPPSVYSKAAPFKIKGYATLWNTNQTASDKQKVQLVKKSLDEGNPVVIAMYVPNSFCYSKGPTWIPESTDAATGNQGHQHGRHAMCIIGYDDKRDGGAFHLQNSWGNNWGNKGYIWVRYQDAAEYVYQAIEIFKMTSLTKKNEAVKLAGSLRLVEDTGQEMKASLSSGNSYRMNKVYRSGTRFRLYLNNSQPAYVYAIGSDLSNEIYQVFPHQKGVSPALNYSQNSVPVPSETHHIRMDGNTGTDFLCVIYSIKPIDLDILKSSLSQQSSRYSFQQKVQNTLGSKMMSDEEIDYCSENGKMSFYARAKGKSVALIFVEMEHTD
jgi:hypothetical protein